MEISEFRRILRLTVTTQGAARVVEQAVAVYTAMVANWEFTQVSIAYVVYLEVLYIWPLDLPTVRLSLGNDGQLVIENSVNGTKWHSLGNCKLVDYMSISQVIRTTLCRSHEK